MKNGFSLMEVIIAITIIALIGTIAATVVTRTFRTTSQAADISKLKENGERAINSMSEAIRMADKVVCYGPLTYDQNANTCYGSSGTRYGNIVIRNQAGKFIRFSFVDPVVSSSCKVSSSGYITRQDNLDPTGVTDDNLFCLNSFPSSPAIALTNQDPLSGVSIRDGAFAKFSSTENKDTVYINFLVNPALDLGGIGSSDTATMQTTIQVR